MLALVDSATRLMPDAAAAPRSIAHLLVEQERVHMSKESLGRSGAIHLHDGCRASA